MPMLPGKENVGSNIREFHKGPTYAHTEDKFGKKDADKQAIAASLHASGESKDDAHKEHRIAIAKMHPANLHQHMQDAAAGKHGPAAQRSAQQAMGQESMAGPKEPTGRSPFSSDNDQDDQQPMGGGNPFAGGQ